MAMSVFPELMDKIDPEDVNSSLRTIESYIHYIVERVEFSLSNTFRTTTTLGSSAEAISLVLQETVNKLSTLTGQVGAVQGDVTGLQTALADEVRPALQSLDERVTALESPEPDPEEEGGT